MENCGRLRAFFRPYFLRSTMRASRVRNPGLLQLVAILAGLEKGAGDAKAKGAGLAGASAAVDAGDDVEVPLGVGHLERCEGRVKLACTRKVFPHPRGR